MRWTKKREFGIWRTNAYEEETDLAWRRIAEAFFFANGLSCHRLRWQEAVIVAEKLALSRPHAAAKAADPLITVKNTGWNTPSVTGSR